MMTPYNMCQMQQQNAIGTLLDGKHEAACSDSAGDSWQKGVILETANWIASHHLTS